MKKVFFLFVVLFLLVSSSSQSSISYQKKSKFKYAFNRFFLECHNINTKKTRSFVGMSEVYGYCPGEVTHGALLDDDSILRDQVFDQHCPEGYNRILDRAVWDNYSDRAEAIGAQADERTKFDSVDYVSNSGARYYNNCQ
jgi:hypothetical protein